MKYLDSSGLSYLWGELKAFFVPKTIKINNKALGADITLSASDVGAATMAQVSAAIDAAITGAIEGEY